MGGWNTFILWVCTLHCVSHIAHNVMSKLTWHYAQLFKVQSNVSHYTGLHLTLHFTLSYIGGGRVNYLIASSGVTSNARTTCNLLVTIQPLWTGHCHQYRYTSSYRYTYWSVKYQKVLFIRKTFWCNRVQFFCQIVLNWHFGILALGTFQFIRRQVNFLQPAT